jgi:hypothetical protein
MSFLSKGHQTLAAHEFEQKNLTPQFLHLPIYGRYDTQTLNLEL